MEIPNGESPAFTNLLPVTQHRIFEFQRELDGTFEGHQRQIVEEALLLMCEVHADQEDRPDGTQYVEHPLRVAQNVLRSLDSPDFEIVASALLHDSVEDQAKKLAAKNHHPDILDKGEEEMALHYIGSRFGGRASRIVISLTNPDFAAELTRDGQEINVVNKNKLYARHVAEIIEDPDVLPIKLFDFAENALRLDEVADPARRLKLTKKYAPVVDVFINRLLEGRHNLNQAVVEELLVRLKATYSQMQNFIEDTQSII